MIDFIVQNNDIRDEGATILANAISSGVALRRLELLVCLLPYAAPNDTRTHLFTHSYATVCLFRGCSQYNGVGIVGTQSLTATVGDKVFKHVSSGIVVRSLGTYLTLTRLDSRS